MFHLYFGAFDIVLYLGGTYFALVLAKAICDDLERPRTAQTTAMTSESSALKPLTPVRSAVPVPRQESAQDTVPVRVTG